MCRAVTDQKAKLALAEIAMKRNLYSRDWDGVSFHLVHLKVWTSRLKRLIQGGPYTTKTIANVSLKTSVTAQTSDISRQNCAELKTLILWHIASIFYIYSSACTATGDSCLKRSQHSWHETTTTGSLFRFFGHESQNTDFTAFLRPVDSDDPLHAALELFPASTQTALDRAFSLIGFASASKCLWIQSLFYNLVW